MSLTFMKIINRKVEEINHSLYRGYCEILSFPIFQTENTFVSNPHFFDVP